MERRKQELMTLIDDCFYKVPEGDNCFKEKNNFPSVLDYSNKEKPDYKVFIANIATPKESIIITNSIAGEVKAIHQIEFYSNKKNKDNVIRVVDLERNKEKLFSLINGKECYIYDFTTNSWEKNIRTKRINYVALLLSCIFMLNIEPKSQKCLIKKQ